MLNLAQADGELRLTPDAQSICARRHSIGVSHIVKDVLIQNSLVKCMLRVEPTVGEVEQHSDFSGAVTGEQGGGREAKIPGVHPVEGGLGGERAPVPADLVTLP